MTIQSHAVVAVCDTHTGTEEALRRILKAGFDMQKLSIGVPGEDIREYETAVREGKIVLVLQGTADEVIRAREILAAGSPAEAITHDR